MRCAFVYAHDGKRFQCVGELDYSEEPESFTFRYTQEWLDRPDAFSIDPFNLPLNEDDFTACCLPGGLADCEVDRFGERAIASTAYRYMRNRRPNGSALNPCRRVLGSAPTRRGFLAFGPDEMGPAQLNGDLEPYEAGSVPGDARDYGLRIFSDAEGSKLVPPRDCHHGAFPGPYFCEAFGRSWVAKIPRYTPGPFTTSHMEAVCLDMAEAIGIETPQRKVVEVEGGSYALLVERFDRHLYENGTEVPLGIVSARSAFGELAWQSPGYADLQAALDRVGGADCRIEIFRRLMLNVAIGNTDDHSFNHCFLRSLDGTWALSPVYDLEAGADGHGLSRSRRYADDGGNPEAMIEAAGVELGLDDATIAAEIVAAAAVTDRWEEFMRARGATQQWLEKMSSVMRPLSSVGSRYACPLP